MKYILEETFKLVFHPFFSKPWINLTPLGRIVYSPIQLFAGTIWFLFMVCLIIPGAIIVFPLMIGIDNLCEKIDPLWDKLFKTNTFLKLKKTFIK
jgi:hypothetical protein